MIPTNQNTVSQWIWTNERSPLWSPPGCPQAGAVVAAGPAEARHLDPGGAGGGGEAPPHHLVHRPSPRPLHQAPPLVLQVCHPRANPGEDFFSFEFRVFDPRVDHSEIIRIILRASPLLLTFNQKP